MSLANEAMGEQDLIEEEIKEGTYPSIRETRF